MGGPHDLNVQNASISYGTWPTSATEVNIRNLSASYDAHVLLECRDGSSEEISVRAGDDVSFSRYFNGFRITLSNANGIPVKVWTV